MVGKKIVLLNLKDSMKYPTYLMMVLLFSALGAFMMIQQGNVFVKNEGTVFGFHYMYVAFNLSIYAMVMTVVITNLCITEKSTGRLEFYLANMVDLNTIHRSYTIVTFILSMTAVVIFNMLLIAYGLISGEIGFIQRLYNIHTFLCFMTYLAFCLSISYLLNLIVLLSRKPQTVRSIIFIVSFIVLYGMLLPVQSIAKIGELSSFGIMRIFIAAFAVFAVGVVCIAFGLKRFLSKETIILSLKQ